MTYQPGDTVHFENATLPVNRTRDYKVTAIRPEGTYVTASGHPYFFTHDQAERLGITKQEPA